MSNELNATLQEVLEKRNQVEILKNQLKAQKADLEIQEEYLVTEMLEAGLKSMKNDDGVLASVTEKINYSVLKQDVDVFHRWLKGKGYGDIIKPTVHSQTMQSFFRNDYEDEELPLFVKEFKKRGITIRGAK